MMLAELPGTGGGKQNDICVLRQRADQDSTGALLQVFGNLQANDKLEATPKVNRRAQIPATKFVGWKQ